MSKSAAHSYLFVPGDRPDRFDKACHSGADVVIIDLEDAVSPSDKASAREAARTWLAEPRSSSGLAAGQPKIAVRVNAADTEWFAADLAMCASVGLPLLVLPKAETAEQLAGVLAACPGIALLPIIESARGFAAAASIASCPGVQRLVFGSIDFQVDMGISGDGQELLYFRSQLVLVSRLAGIESPVDGVSTALDDAEAVMAETRRGLGLGFGAKLCIHPRQVALVNTACAPTPADVAWARRVLLAAEASNGAAVALDGKMVDKPVILKARAILAKI